MEDENKKQTETIGRKSESPSFKKNKKGNAGKRSATFTCALPIKGDNMKNYELAYILRIAVVMLSIIAICQ